MSILTKEERTYWLEVDQMSAFTYREMVRAIKTINTLEADLASTEKERHELTTALSEAVAELNRADLWSAHYRPEIKGLIVELARAAKDKIISNKGGKK